MDNITNFSSQVIADYSSQAIMEETMNYSYQTLVTSIKNSAFKIIIEGMKDFIIDKAVNNYKTTLDLLMLINAILYPLEIRAIIILILEKIEAKNAKQTISCDPKDIIRIKEYDLDQLEEMARKEGISLKENIKMGSRDNGFVCSRTGASIYAKLLFIKGLEKRHRLYGVKYSDLTFIQETDSLFEKMSKKDNHVLVGRKTSAILMSKDELDADLKRIAKSEFSETEEEIEVRCFSLSDFADLNSAIAGKSEAGKEKSIDPSSHYRMLGIINTRVYIACKKDALKAFDISK